MSSVCSSEVNGFGVPAADKRVPVQVLEKEFRSAIMDYSKFRLSKMAFRPQSISACGSCRNLYHGGL